MTDTIKANDIAGSFSASHWTAGSVLQTMGSVLKAAAKPALLAALGLIAVWCLGRIMEAIHGNAVFDLALTYWLGLVIFILLALWVIGSGTRAKEDFGKVRDRKTALVSWIFFVVLVFTVLFTLKGYRTSSEGLFAALAGSAENSRLASFLLFKFHSLSPMIVLNLAASKIAGAGLDMASLAPYVWSWNALFAFFIWSLAFGIVILMEKHKRGPKCVHLFLAAFGLLVLIILKSLTRPTVEQLMVIQAAAAIMLAFQILLAYATVRAVAAGPVEDVPKGDPFRVTAPQEEKTAKKRFVGLPPSALALALALFLVLPVLADLLNQFALSYSSTRIVQKISATRAGSAPSFVAVAPVSIRSGPATGDELVGILPRGTDVQALDKKNDWVKIGENNWVQEKFLRPTN